MIRIGITGGIGSGKSTVCRVFETFGIPIFYADTVAKEIMVSDPILTAGIKNTFGAESYNSEGKLNNQHIAGIVFNNSSELAKLNKLVHPAVFRAFDEWLAGLPEYTRYIIKEAALLFESGSYKLCDKNILVTAPLAMKLERVMDRDGVSEAQVKARMDKQMSDEEKVKMADYLIKNDESQSVILQVMELHHQILNITE